MEEYKDLIEVLSESVALLTMFVIAYFNYQANKTAEGAIRETQIIQELESRPFVYFSILMEEGYRVVSFELLNKGKGVAKNIRLSLNQALKRKPEGEVVQEMAIFKPLSFLTSQSNFKESVGICDLFFEVNKECEEVTGKVEYQDASGKSYSTPVHIYLKVLNDKRDLKTPTLDNFVESLELIDQIVQQPRKK